MLRHSVGSMYVLRYESLVFHNHNFPGKEKQKNHEQRTKEKRVCHAYLTDPTENQKQQKPGQYPDSVMDVGASGKMRYCRWRIDMKVRKRIMVILCAVFVTASFLPPFYAQISYAEDQKIPLAEDETEEACKSGTEEEKEETKEGIREAQQDNSTQTEEKTKTENSPEEVQEEKETTTENDEEKQPEENEAEEKIAEEKKPEEKETEAVEKEQTEAESSYGGEKDGEEESPEQIKESDTTPAAERVREESPSEKEDTVCKEAAEDAAQTQAEEAGIAESEEAYHPARMRLAARSVGISGSAPMVGQENSYNCINGVETWTVPANGKYRISCYGGAGGDQKTPDDSLSGGTGSIRQGTIQLTKGTVLYINVGGNGLDGYRHSNGDEEGNPGSYNGGAAAGYDTSDLGNHGRYWTHGAGGGASDVRMGNNDPGSQIIVAGGGGGANKKTTGSNGDSGSYNGRRLEGTNEGGGGGYYGGNAHQGGSSYVNTSYFTDISERNGGSTEGRVVIRVVTLFPKIALSASREWTNKEVAISASVLSDGEGRPGAYLCWEKEASGADRWTSDSTFAATHNGSYVCKIRDTAGNITEASWEVKNIDRLAPIPGEISLSTEEWTDETVSLSVMAEDAPATGEDGCSGLAVAAYAWGKKEFSGRVIWGSESLAQPEESAAQQAPGIEHDEDAEQEQTPVWGKENTLTVSENGTYVCRVRDLTGNMEETVCTVTNIDRTPPRFTCSRPDQWYEGGTHVTVDASDLQPDGTEGSGLAEKAFSLDGVLYTSSPTLFIEKEGSYEIWVRDRMGNIKKETVTFLYDQREPLRVPEENQRQDSQEEEKPEEERRDKDKNKGGKKESPIPLPLMEEPAEKAEPEERGAGTVTVPPAISVLADLTNRTEESGKVISRQQPLPSLTSLITAEPSQIPLSHEKEKKIPVMEKQKEQEETAKKISREEAKKWDFDWKQAALYSVWMAVVLCGLLWLLFALIFEHATVYRKDERGKYQKIGRCAIVRKKDYKQINLLHVMKKGEERDYKVCFAAAFVFLYRKEKVMVRTWYGVELRNVAKEIEICSCNSENHVLT